MGFALARAAFDRGASVDLIEANVDMPAVPGVRQIETPTAGEMHAEVLKRLPDTDILIMAAAVADYRVADGPAGGKIGKSRDEWSISLEATADILCDVAAHHQGQCLVGFAAEYGLEGLDRGREKMARKQLDMIVFQRHLAHRHRFRVRLQRGPHLTHDSEVLIEKAPKETVAELILDNIAVAVRGRRGEKPRPHSSQYFCRCDPFGGCDRAVLSPWSPAIQGLPVTMGCRCLLLRLGIHNALDLFRGGDKPLALPLRFSQLSGDPAHVVFIVRTRVGGG